MTSLLLALDFGGTKHAAAIALQGETQWLNIKRTLAAPNGTGETDRAIMRSLIHQLLNGAKPMAIGVSFGGPVHFASGTVRLSHHVPGWENVPLQQWLETELGVPAQVDNDANAAALGEYRFGAGQGWQDLFYITVSTGVGGGWILNGKPWRGYESMAGEIGHMVVDPQGPICLCGKRGCVERLASGPYLAQQFREDLAQHPDRDSILRSIGQTQLEKLTALQVSQAAAQGDELAQAAIRRSAWAIGVAIGNIANLINPQRFILGGGVTKSGDLFWQTVRETARNTALPEVRFEIVPAALSDDAPLWGAIALAEAALCQDGSR